MQRQYWRWLWIWVGVLVAGCGQFWSSNGTPPPPRDTALPLLGYTFLPPSLTPNLWPVHTVTPRLLTDGTTAALSPVALYLVISGPICTETPVGSLVCLGQVHNSQGIPVERVMVGVQLLSQNGAPLVTGEIWLARWRLPAGASGPYYVVFNNVPPDYAGAYAFIRSGQFAPGNAARYTDLTIEATDNDAVGNQVRIAVTVRNDTPMPVGPVLVTVTLLDADGQVTGFRQVYTDSDDGLLPGESHDLTVTVIPQRPGTVTWDIFAEGVLTQN